jgi:hypothetical protein
MAVYTVTDDMLCSEQAATYFQRADRRVMIGLRASLEILGIPVPDYAKRKPPGVAPSRAVESAYQADHGKPRNYTLAPRKPNATPQAVAKAKSRS